MEDVELMKRIKWQRGRIIILPDAVTNLRESGKLMVYSTPS